ncbi:hypothetical protein DFP90_10258 [Aestuariispira insulae]|uniref:Uncharacterized protein n=1 Tax=Aestuariispira insulae TaxID=1461337 RepID=A0A3D9HRC6_9PROT|nr:hypothetical protein DFP90_10258 [Aestuariispira insulae]
MEKTLNVTQIVSTLLAISVFLGLSGGLVWYALFGL